MPRESRAPSAKARYGAFAPAQPSPLKSPVKVPLNDDREEKAVRLQSRHALQEMQMNSIKAAASPIRKRKSIGPNGSPRTPTGENKEDSGGAGASALGGVGAVTPVKRVPILANFEEWMKMATDNKINATNSWNFALIDYFHDMSLLREGDSVNFQKASCTLDGCVKIYTSRVDSVATETGKLLSGLADSGNKKRKDEEAEDGHDDDEEDGEEGGKKRKKRVQRSSEATLASSFAQLQVKKMELEFSVDPLFKKASADFDEGGAKGLLLNHLTIDGQGRIVFDSSEDAQETTKSEDPQPEPQDDEQEQQETPKPDNDTHQDFTHESPQQSIDIESLRQRFFPDLSKLDEQDICPSLKSFELGGANDALDIPFLKASDDWKKNSPSKNRDGDANDGPAPIDDDDDDDDAGLGGFDIGVEVGFGEGGEAWAKDAALDTQPRPYDGGFETGAGEGNGDDGGPGDHVGGYDADSAQYGVTLFRNQNNHDNILSYFDQALHKNWAGPEHWRIRKIKDVNSKPATAPRQRKEKEPFEIDFAAPMTKSMADALYTPATNTSAICLPRAQWRSKTRNLLPDDKHFNSRQLLRLFLKPKARIGARTPVSGMRNGSSRGPQGTDDIPEGQEMDEAFWARRHAENAATHLAADEQAAAHGDYDANFFQDDALGAPPDVDDDDEVFTDAPEALPGADGVGESQGPVDPNTDVLANGQSQAGGFGTQLVTQSRRLRPEYVQYARVAKKVDVRRLKEEMWRGIGFSDPSGSDAEVIADKTPDAAGADPSKSPEDDGKSLRFTKVMNGLQSAYPKQVMADISTSYCFICLLHLANEKGLILGNEERERFEEIMISKDESAVVEEGAI